MKIVTRIAIGTVGLVLVCAITGLLAFNGLARLVGSRAQSPHLERRPETASDLVYRTLNGETRHLASSKGKVVFLDLWGTWCLQCVAEMPTVQKLYDHYKGDPQVEFLIVSRLDLPSTVRSYAQLHGFDLPFYIMRDADIPTEMQLQQFPSTFIYAKDGSMAAKHVGAADWSDRSVIQFIDSLRRQLPAGT